MTGNERHIPGTQFNRAYGQILHDVAVHRDVVIVEAHGRAQAVILSVEEYEEYVMAKRQLEALNLQIIDRR